MMASAVASMDLGSVSPAWFVTDPSILLPERMASRIFAVQKLTVPRLVLMSAGMPDGFFERDRVVCAMANEPGAATDTEPHSCDAYAVMWRRSLPYIDLAPFVNSAVQCSVS